MLSRVQVNSEQVGLKRKDAKRTLNRWVLSLLRKQVIDSAVLTSAGRSFYHSGAKTEKSCDLAVQPLLALRDGGTSRPAEVGCAGGL